PQAPHVDGRVARGVVQDVFGFSHGRGSLAPPRSRTMIRDIPHGGPSHAAADPPCCMTSAAPAFGLEPPYPGWGEPFVIGFPSRASGPSVRCRFRAAPQ